MMGLDRRMGLLLSGRRSSPAVRAWSGVRAVVWLIVFAATAPLLAAQSVSVSEREAIVRVHVARGGRPQDVEALLRQADAAGAKGLPVAVLTNKIREGLAKGADVKRIEIVVGQMAIHLESADRLVREIMPGASGQDAVTLLAEALGAGVTPQEVREIQRQTQAAIPARGAADTLAGSAKSLAFIKEAKLPTEDGTAVVVEAMRRGFRAGDIVDLGREVKRRERDYQSGRASLRGLRDAIARGDKPEQLLRESGAAAPPERPAATRPETPATRPEPASRPDAAPPERPVQPERPVRPEPPTRPTGRNP